MMAITANVISESLAKASVHRYARYALFTGIALLAAACGGGDPNADKVTLGTGQGQSANPVTVDYPIFAIPRPFPSTNG